MKKNERNSISRDTHTTHPLPAERAARHATRRTHTLLGLAKHTNDTSLLTDVAREELH